MGGEGRGGGRKELTLHGLVLKGGYVFESSWGHIPRLGYPVGSDKKP